MSAKFYVSVEGARQGPMRAMSCCSRAPATSARRTTALRLDRPGHPTRNSSASTRALTTLASFGWGDRGEAVERG